MNGYLKLVTGNLGGGKTSYVAELIAYHLRDGGYVATNIELRLDEIAEWIRSEGFVFDPSRVIILKGDLDQFYAQIPRGSPERVVMVAIDEAAITGFNSRDFAKLDRTVFNFCTLARKLDVGMWWVTQRPQFFDKQLRELCVALIDCRDMRQFKLWGFVPLPLPLLVRVHHQMVDGRPRYPTPEVVFRKKWVWKLYNSDALLGDAANKFANMLKVNATPLPRIVQTGPSSFSPFIVSLCASFFVCF